MTVAAAETADGVYVVELESGEVIAHEACGRVDAPSIDVGLPLTVVAARAGSTVVAVVNRRPPLVVSYDAGATWREAGGGLPEGRAVAISIDNPDLVVYGARNRLYISRDGGRFWAALGTELPEILALEVREGA